MVVLGIWHAPATWCLMLLIAKGHTVQYDCLLAVAAQPAAAAGTPDVWYAHLKVLLQTGLMIHCGFTPLT